MIFASVAELVDALDLGSSGATCESSSLSARTMLNDHKRYNYVSRVERIRWVTA